MSLNKIQSQQQQQQKPGVNADCGSGLAIRRKWKHIILIWRPAVTTVKTAMSVVDISRHIVTSSQTASGIQTMISRRSTERVGVSLTHKPSVRTTDIKTTPRKHSRGNQIARGPYLSCKYLQIDVLLHKKNRWICHNSTIKQKACDDDCVGLWQFDNRRLSFVNYVRHEYLQKYQITVQRDDDVQHTLIGRLFEVTSWLEYDVLSIWLSCLFLHAVKDQMNT